MKYNIIKQLGCCAAVMGSALVASAQPPTAAVPPGLDPSSGPTYPSPNGGNPVAIGEVLIASGGPVYVTQLGPTGAAFDEQLFLASPANSYGNFLDDHSTPNGTTYSLGTFAAGTEIEFGLDVISEGYNVFDGPGIRNPDGDVHAYMVNNYQGLADTTYVGFEDELAPNSDFNYADEIFAFTGTTASPNVPDGASTMYLLGAGVTVLGCMSRRLRK